MRPTPGANPPAAVERVLAGPHAQHRMAYLAGKLIENGYPIIPVRWGGKSPLLDDWTSKDWQRPPTIEEVNGWLAHWPDCGVGIPCGRVIAVDIDILDSLATLGGACSIWPSRCSATRPACGSGWNPSGCWSTGPSSRSRACPRGRSRSSARVRSSSPTTCTRTPGGCTTGRTRTLSKCRSTACRDHPGPGA